MGDICEFLVADVFEAFAGCRELLVNLNGFLGHDFMRFLSAPHEDEVGSGSDALVTVSIEAETNHQRFAAGLSRFLGVSHMRQGRTEGEWRQ